MVNVCFMIGTQGSKKGLQKKKRLETSLTSLVTTGTISACNFHKATMYVATQYRELKWKIARKIWGIVQADVLKQWSTTEA